MFASRTNWNRRPNALSLALDDARASGRRVLDLAASNPTRCGLPLDEPAILAALSDPRALTYDPDPRGLPHAREAVAAYYASRGDAVSPADLLLTASTSEAYSFVFRALCDPGDEILVPAPSYPLFDFLASLHDVRVSRYPLFYDHGWQIDFHALAQAITPRTRAILVVHPNNPTGQFARPREIENLNRVALHHGLAIVADEVFFDFQHTPANDAARPPSFASNSAALTFTLSGISKISGLPQMKVAWILAQGPPPQKKEALARLEIIADTFLSVGAPVQCALPRFLELRNAFHAAITHRLRKNLAALDRVLAAYPACSRLEFEAGWYAVLRVPVTRPDEDLAVALLRAHGVYVHPGHYYDFSGEGNFVVSLIPPEEEFSAGIRALLAMV